MYDNMCKEDGVNLELALEYTFFFLNSPVNVICNVALLRNFELILMLELNWHKWKRYMQSRNENLINSFKNLPGKQIRFSYAATLFMYTPFRQQSLQLVGIPRVSFQFTQKSQYLQPNFCYYQNWFFSKGSIRINWKAFKNDLNNIKNREKKRYSFFSSNVNISSEARKDNNLKN